MPRRREKELIRCQFYTWRLGCRGGIWQVDGRSNRPDVGRHSLGTSDYEEAKRLVVELDLVAAVKHGLADPSAIAPARREGVALDEGVRLYMEFAARARVTGGVRPSTRERYKSIFGKFVEYARGRGLRSWDGVNASILQGYAAHLEGRDFAYRTQYLELTTLKQAILWMVKQGHLPPECRIELPLQKAGGTDRYCWRTEEVQAMVLHCRERPHLFWMADILLALATTGLRISELAALRWSDVDLVGGMIRLVDETTSARRRDKKAPVRQLKSGRDRRFPIQDELMPVLRGMARHPDGSVFHGPGGKGLTADRVRSTLIRDVLGPLAARFPTAPNEVGFADGRLHSFRHYFCSLCANRGVPQRVVMRWLGHTESRMVEHYYHLYDEEARLQMGKIKLFEGGSGGRVAADG